MSASQYVLYHADCADGFGAAFAAWKRLGDKDTAYIPVRYGEDLPAMPGAEQVWIVDFSYPRDVLNGLQAILGPGHLVVLDHHASAEKHLKGASYAGFDMNKSGAVLAWEHFHAGTYVPPLLRYVEDRDLWRWKCPQSREVSFALRSCVDWDFRSWSLLLDEWGTFLPKLVTWGNGIRKHVDKEVGALCRVPDRVEIGGTVVPTVMASNYHSEVGERLLQNNPQCRFAAVWRMEGNHARVSLRACGRESVAFVAEAFGGGGHMNASGFSVPMADWLAAITRGREASVRKEVAA